MLLKKHILILAAVFLVSSGVAHASKRTGELVLSNHFKVSELHAMPCAETWLGQTFRKIDYPELDAAEWQVSLRVSKVRKSPLYDDVKSADFVVHFPSDDPITLHWSKGSHAEATDFQPYTQLLNSGTPIVLESFGGRSSDGVMPYFNLEGVGGGLIIAVGWSGGWKAEFKSLADGRVQIVAGLQRSHFKLRPGETVRLPSVLVMSYCGDWIDGQNRFRRLMLAHFTPKSHAPMDLMPVAGSVHGVLRFNETTEENLEKLATDLAAAHLPLDTYWLDAGWNKGGFPLGQGNPEADPVRFPNGLAPVGDAVNRTGMRFLVWFEPERAMRGTWLDDQHADWLLVPSGTPETLRYMENDGFRLLDFGSKEARTWALETISRDIRDANVEIYRQDFNEYPSFFWQTDEQQDEIGLREVRHISGFYDFLDELVRQHPGLILDNCASGGRRLDFEMMRRCVVLWRSDCCWSDASFPRNVQAMTYGLSLWLPLHGLGAKTADAVAFRSGMGACASFPLNFYDPEAVSALRRHLELYLPIRHLFAADYYPLTEWSDDPEKWLAFQFHDSAANEGIVQAFCSTSMTNNICTVKLRGLDPDQDYMVTDWDNLSTPTKISGGDLITRGLELHAGSGGTARVFHYKRAF